MMRIYRFIEALRYKYGYPFTIFIATDPVDNNLKNYMDWDQIRELRKVGTIVPKLNHPTCIDYPQLR